MDRHVEVMSDVAGFSSAPMAPQIFGNAGREHMKKYGRGLSIAVNLFS